MIRVLFSGDSMIVKDQKTKPKGFAELVSVIQDSDVAFTNLETTIPSEEAYPGKFWNQGIPISAPPESIEQLKQIGIDGVSCANNHSFDWGTQGLLDTIEVLQEKGMPYSGAGYNKAEARKALTLEIKGMKIGMIGITARYPTWGIALDSIDGYPGKPGIHTLEIRERPYFSFELNIFGKSFVHQTGSFFPNRYFVNQEEFLELLTHIQEQASKHDMFFISFHYHEAPERKRISKVLKYVCRSFIDSGACGVFVHGGHKIKGFEVYKQKPIFYGVGNLFYQAQSGVRLHPEFMPKEAVNKGETYQHYNKNRKIWNDKDVFKAIMPVCSYNSDNELVYVDIYPVDLGFEDGENKGTPRLGNVNDLDIDRLIIGTGDLKEMTVKQGFIRYEF